MTDLVSPDSRRVEPPATAPHYHVWRDHGQAQTLMRPRFGTRQAARKAALRAGMEPGTFTVRKCQPQHGPNFSGPPCRVLIRRTRKPQRKCRHCGRIP